MGSNASRIELIDSLGTLISEPGIINNHIISISDLLRKKKSVLYYPLENNYKYTIFAYFRYKNLVIQDNNIQRIEVQNHITKPLVNFKNIIGEVKDDFPKIGLTSWLYFLK